MIIFGHCRTWPARHNDLAIPFHLEHGSAGALCTKLHADAAGLAPDVFAGHSLRSGFLTSAAEAGADVLRMMEVSRHKRVETMQGYVRRASLFKGHAGAGFL